MHESSFLTFCAQGIVKRFDLAVLTEGLAREMSLPFPQLNGPYCVEHIITFYRLPRLFLLLLFHSHSVVFNNNTHHRSIDKEGAVAVEPSSSRHCADGNPVGFCGRVGSENDV